MSWSILLKHHLADQKVGTMISLQCPIPGCSYATPKMSETVACALLAAHTPVHTSASIVGAANHSNGPKLKRPKVDVGIIEEEWNIFTLGSFHLRVKFKYKRVLLCLRLLATCFWNVIPPLSPNQPLSFNEKHCCHCSSRWSCETSVGGYAARRGITFESFCSTSSWKTRNVSLANWLFLWKLSLFYLYYHSRDVLIAGIKDIAIPRDMLKTMRYWTWVSMMLWH